MGSTPIRINESGSSVVEQQTRVGSTPTPDGIGMAEQVDAQEEDPAIKREVHRFLKNGDNMQSRVYLSAAQTYDS